MKENLCHSAKVGDFLPPLVKTPTEISLFRYSAATCNSSRIHFDRDYARSEGLPGTVVHADLGGAYLAQMLVDWAGPSARLKTLSWENRAAALLGDTITSRGTVVQKQNREGMAAIACELSVENQAGARLMNGKSVVVCPDSESGMIDLSLAAVCNLAGSVKPPENGPEGARDWLSSEARSVIGKWSQLVPVGLVTAKEVHTYALAAGDANPLYACNEAARLAGYEGIIAPPTFLTSVRSWEGGKPEAELGPGGREPDDAKNLALVGAARQLGGGQRLEFFRPVRIGVPLNRRARVIDIFAKQGKRGRLVFVAWEYVFTDENGELLTRCVEIKIAY